jgi:hypothetical protein
MLFISSVLLGVTQAYRGSASDLATRLGGVARSCPPGNYGYALSITVSSVCDAGSVVRSAAAVVRDPARDRDLLL